MGDAELLAGCAILDRERLTTAFGHLSERTPDGHVRISGNAGPGLNREPDQFVTLGVDGELLAGLAGTQAGEAPIHLGIYRARPDVQSVCRFHGPACLAWGARNRPLPAVIGMGLFCGHEVPVHDTQITITTPEQGAALARTLGGERAVLVRGFGAVTVGRSVQESVVRAWLLEQNARAALDARDAGGYPADAAAAFDPEHSPPAAGQIARAWHYLKERA